MQSILGILLPKFSFSDAEFLHRSLMRSILDILYPVSQLQNFYILARCSRFWVFCLKFSDAEFLYIKLGAVDIRYLVSSFQMQNFCILA